MNGALKRYVRFSTDDVAADQRLDYWSASSIDTIVDINCRTFDESGLHATQRAMQLDVCSIVEVAANEHSIERTAPQIRKHRKDSVFLDLLVAGNSFHYQRNGCVASTPGDMVLYDPDQPYVHGFTHGMRQITFDVPKDCLRSLNVSATHSAPTKLGGLAGPGRFISKWLLEKVDELARKAQQTGRIETAQRDELWQLLEAALGQLRSGGSGTSSHTLTLMRARAYVHERLSDPDLDSEAVARAVGVSVRHVHRVFESSGVTLRQFIIGKRLGECAHSLQDHALNAATIAEIGYRWGFNDAVYFCRSFKKRYGVSPREFRAAASQDSR